MPDSAIRTRILHDQSAAETYRLLRAHVNAENRQRGIEQSNQPIGVFQWDDTQGMIAGACGTVYPGWLCIDLLWVEETRRRQGTGAGILQQLEAEAQRLGVHSAYVWTQDFEAPDFYRKHGYTDFVQFEEFLPGHQLIGMQKKLSRSHG